MLSVCVALLLSVLWKDAAFFLFFFLLSHQIVVGNAILQFCNILFKLHWEIHFNEGRKSYVHCMDRESSGVLRSLSLRSAYSNPAGRMESKGWEQAQQEEDVEVEGSVVELREQQALRGEVATAQTAAAALAQKGERDLRMEEIVGHHKKELRKLSGCLAAKLLLKAFYKRKLKSTGEALLILQRVRRSAQLLKQTLSIDPEDLEGSDALLCVSKAFEAYCAIPTYSKALHFFNNRMTQSLLSLAQRVCLNLLNHIFMHRNYWESVRDHSWTEVRSAQARYNLWRLDRARKRYETLLGFACKEKASLEAQSWGQLSTGEGLERLEEVLELIGSRLNEELIRFDGGSAKPLNITQRGDGGGVVEEDIEDTSEEELEEKEETGKDGPRKKRRVRGSKNGTPAKLGSRKNRQERNGLPVWTRQAHTSEQTDKQIAIALQPLDAIQDCFEMLQRVDDKAWVAIKPLEHPVHFWRNVVLVGVLVLAGGYIWQTQGDNIMEWVLNSAQAMVVFFEEHVTEPVYAIYDTVFKTFRQRKLLPSEEALRMSKEQLEEMLRNYGNKQPNAKDVAERARRGDMSLVMDPYIEDMKNPLKSVMMGNLTEALLIQFQKIKVDTDNSFLTMEQLLKAQELNFQVMTIFPAFVFAVLVAYISTASAKYIFRDRNPTRIQEQCRQLLRELALSLVHSAPSVKHPTRRAHMVPALSRMHSSMHYNLIEPTAGQRMMLTRAATSQSLFESYQEEKEEERIERADDLLQGHLIWLTDRIILTLKPVVTKPALERLAVDLDILCHPRFSAWQKTFMLQQLYRSHVCLPSGA